MIVDDSDPRAKSIGLTGVKMMPRVFALQEPDSSGPVCDPPHAAWEPLQQAILPAARVTGDRLDGYGTELDEQSAKAGALTCRPVMWPAWGTRR